MNGIESRQSSEMGHCSKHRIDSTSWKWRFTASWLLCEKGRHDWLGLHFKTLFFLRWLSSRQLTRCAIYHLCHFLEAIKPERNRREKSLQKYNKSAQWLILLHVEEIDVEFIFLAMVMWTCRWKKNIHPSE